MTNYSNFIGLPYKCRGRGPKYYDCYGLCIKVYKETAGIILPDHLEVDYDDRWYDKGKNCILDTIKDNWDYTDKPFKKHDLIVLFNGTELFPNHVGLWVSKNKILHIYEGNSSHIDRYEGYWESKFHCALRWKNG